jgi:hypothetical protein
MAKPDPSTDGSQAKAGNNGLIALPVKLPHPVVLEEQERRAADIQLRIVDWITGFADADRVAGYSRGRTGVRSSCSPRFGRNRRRAASIKCFVLRLAPASGGLTPERQHRNADRCPGIQLLDLRVGT